MKEDYNNNKNCNNLNITYNKDSKQNETLTNNYCSANYELIVPTIIDKNYVEATAATNTINNFSNKTKISSSDYLLLTEKINTLEKKNIMLQKIIEYKANNKGKNTQFNESLKIEKEYFVINDKANTDVEVINKNCFHKAINYPSLKNLQHMTKHNKDKDKSNLDIKFNKYTNNINKYVLSRCENLKKNDLLLSDYLPSNSISKEFDNNKHFNSYIDIIKELLVVFVS